MPNSSGSILRTAGLWTLIVAASASTLIDFTKGNTQWGWAKLMIFALVLAHEIYRFLTRGETISTKYKKFIERYPVWGWLSLGLFTLSLIGLIVHLAAW